MPTPHLLARAKFWGVIAVRMLRFRTVVLMITFSTIGYEAVNPSRTIPLKLVWVAIMLGSLYISATCFNDAADIDIDKINLKGDLSRPLITTNVTARQLQALGVIALGLAIIAAVLVNPLYLLLVAMGIVLNICYSVPPVRMSHRGILASLWLSVSYVVLPFLAGIFIANKPISHQTWYLLVGMYAGFVGRILLKDFRDYEGDKKFNKLNFLVRHGPAATSLASAIAWGIGDLILSGLFYSRFPLMVILFQPLSLILFYQLYLLAHEKKYKRKLAEVAVVGRMGNAVTLALLAALTLQAFDYGTAQNNLIIIGVALIVALTGLNVLNTQSPASSR